MGIIFDETNKVFLLNTKNTTYGIAVKEGMYLNHLYNGKKLEDTNIRYLMRGNEPPLIHSVNKREKNSFLDMAPMEYPETGMGDYRESAFCVRSEGGHRASELSYQSYQIIAGKPELEGLPATWGGEEDCTTLELFCRDETLGMEVQLLYTVFEEEDAITRSVIVKNAGNSNIYLEKVLSTCLDMDDRNFEVIGLFGSWGRERHIHGASTNFRDHETP